ncbi:nitrate reductase [Chloroflexi bacterium TSY]|nr:nitrate reductase [Chloroflexi bacterium TSY]
MNQQNNLLRGFRSARVLIIGLTATIVVLVLALVAIAIGRSAVPATTAEVPRVNVLAESTDDCVTCHKQTTPGIVEQYGHSSMAAADVSCQDCHVVEADYSGATEHEGVYVLGSPTTAMCGKCHVNEVAQFNQSRHALPAYVAYNGTDGLSPEHLAMYEGIPEGGFAPDKMRNALFELEGPEITEFACKGCHDIGKPAADGSVGECKSCHLRHEFSLEQVRKPETCNACHIGPDHPQWEIYQESPHGIAYATGGDNWHWEAKPGTLTTVDFPAPTCATCHMSGFGTSATTHDVGDRLTWYLFAPISQRRPAWQDNMTRMQGVCRDCHNQGFVEEFYTKADAATEKVNSWVEESNEIIAPLKDAGLLTSEPFDQPIDFTHFNLWHHWGRTAKFGVWMQGADYVQWHGAYEILHDMAELREMVEEIQTRANGGSGETETSTSE